VIKWLLTVVLVLLPWSIASQGFDSAFTPSKLEINGTDGEVTKNIEAFLAPFINEPFTAYQRQEALKATEKAMQALGFYHVKVTMQIEQSSETLTLDIEAGEPLTWSSIDVQIRGQAHHDKVIKALLTKLPLKTGKQVRHDHYQSTKQSLESALLERGYFDLKWQSSQLRIAKKTSKAHVILHLASGPRYQFGDITINSDTKAQIYIRSLATFESATPYDTSLLSDYNLALNATAYFQAVKVYPLLKDRKYGKIQVRVEAVDKPANSFEVGGGYSTDLGAKTRFKWTKPWLTDDGHFFESNLNLAQHQQDLSGTYTIPVNDPNNDVWRVMGGFQRQSDINQGIDSEILNLQLQRQWLTSDNWIRTAFIKREHETTTQNGVATTTQMLLPGISYTKKRSQGGALPFWGDEQMYALEFASNAVASSTSLVKLRWNNAWLRTFDDKHLFYGRLNLGAIISDDIQEVPFNMRFLAGGDQSIRGFAYQSVSPRQNSEIIGGKYIATGAMEYNYQFLPNWRAALFVDAGTATNDFSEKLSVGAGFGIRYLTPIGPIRINHAWGVSKQSKSTRLSIVIGPEI
jgi:translocation and assembly module TamA